MAFAGWPLTGILSALLVAMSAAVLATAGTDAEGVSTWVRATARSSALLFALAYVARPLRQLWRAPASAWLLRNRRYLGVSMAVSHALHGIGIVWYLTGFEGIPYQADPATLAFGGLGFVFVGLMAITSSDAAVARLGRARWQTLHRAGMHYLWFIFVFTFAGPLAAGAAPGLYGPIVAALVGAAALRATVALRARSRSSPAVA